MKQSITTAETLKLTTCQWQQTKKAVHKLFDRLGKILSKQKLSEQSLLMMVTLLFAVLSKPVIGVAQDTHSSRHHRARIRTLKVVRTSVDPTGCVESPTSASGHSY